MLKALFLREIEVLLTRFEIQFHGKNTYVPKYCYFPKIGLKFNLTKKYLRYNLDIFFSHVSTFHKDSVASIYGLGVFN